MLWFLMGAAWSHPFEVDFFGHDVQVVVDGTSLEVEYVL